MMAPMRPLIIFGILLCAVVSLSACDSPSSLEGEEKYRVDLSLFSLAEGEVIGLDKLKN